MLLLGSEPNQFKCRKLRHTEEADLRTQMTWDQRQWFAASPPPLLEPPLNPVGEFPAAADLEGVVKAFRWAALQPGRAPWLR